MQDNKESSNYCRHHWKTDIEDGKATRVNTNKDDKKEISKKTIKEKNYGVNLTEESTPEPN